ncbi:hypothetical protein CW304_20865 [Bacillus sp. UFRGS-B20]|nr:hypothetical protein CW304_20865 [Bacillus sp. UFRGS-B20]
MIEVNRLVKNGDIDYIIIESSGIKWHISSFVSNVTYQTKSLHIDFNATKLVHTTQSLGEMNLARIAKNRNRAFWR